VVFMLVAGRKAIAMGVAFGSAELFGVSFALGAFAADARRASCSGIRGARGDGDGDADLSAAARLTTGAVAMRKSRAAPVH
jgi:hypothetical protein